MRRSASTSLVLACIASIVPGGLLSASPGGSCILGGLALLLLVFQVDTISNLVISFICKGIVVPHTTPTDDASFQPDWAEACWGRWAGPGLLASWYAGSWIVGAEVGLLQCWSAGSKRGTPLQKQERRGVSEGFARGHSDA